MRRERARIDGASSRRVLVRAAAAVLILGVIVASSTWLDPTDDEEQVHTDASSEPVSSSPDVSRERSPVTELATPSDQEQTDSLLAEVSSDASRPEVRTTAPDGRSSTSANGETTPPAPAGPIGVTTTTRPPDPGPSTPIRSVSVSPVVPRPGELVTITIVIDEPQPTDVVHLRTGVWSLESAGRRCGPLDTSPPITETVTFVRAFRLSGPHEYNVMLDRCNQEFVVPLVIDVAEGTAPANGPEMPYFTKVERTWDQVQGTYQRRLAVHATDDDGMIERVIIDWGDGSAPEEFIAYSAMDMQSLCDPTREYDRRGVGSSYPAPPAAWTHTVTVTLVSIGCNGADPQQAVATLPAG